MTCQSNLTNHRTARIFSLIILSFHHIVQHTLLYFEFSKIFIAYEVRNLGEVESDCFLFWAVYKVETLHSLPNHDVFLGDVAAFENCHVGNKSKFRKFSIINCRLKISPSIGFFREIEEDLLEVTDI